MPVELCYVVKEVNGKKYRNYYLKNGDKYVFIKCAYDKDVKGYVRLSDWARCEGCVNK